MDHTSLKRFAVLIHFLLIRHEQCNPLLGHTFPVMLQRENMNMMYELNTHRNLDVQTLQTRAWTRNLKYDPQ